MHRFTFTTYSAAQSRLFSSLFSEYTKVQSPTDVKDVEVKIVGKEKCFSRIAIYSMVIIVSLHISLTI